MVKITTCHTQNYTDEFKSDVIMVLWDTSEKNTMIPEVKVSFLNNLSGRDRE